MADPGGRGAIFRWMGWFALANAVVLAVVGLRYFSGFAGGGSLLSWIYVVLIYPGHHVLLAAAPLFVLLTPVVLLCPRRRILTALGVLLYATMIAVIVLDSLLWSESRFHLNALTAQILGWQSWVFAGMMFLVALPFEYLLAGWIWRLTGSRSRLRGGWVGTLAAMAIIAAQLIHAWSDAAYYVPVTSVGQQLPVYEGFTAKRQLTRLGLVDAEASRDRQTAQRLSRQLDERAGRVLNYPQNPLQCVADRPLNVLLILADALRDDVVTAENTPFLWQFARNEAQWFTRHFSGGNSSRMGVFSLFYGLPPGYWSSFESMHRSPVLMDELERQGYRFGLFSSATMYRPVSLDRTAFARVPNLRLGTEPLSAPSWQRDLTVASDWFDWLDGHEDSHPFFGFLFFDATNAQDYPDELDRLPGFAPERNDELARRFADYRKSARFVDGVIESVFADLESRGVADHTVVIVSSDHGEEFDDSGAGLRDHGSGYTRYQLQVPMLMRWPQRAGRRYDHRTSHYDFVPTLMEEVLGCVNPPEDYASGRNLFDGESWPWLLAGSYYNYAVLEPDQITITYPNGRFEVRDWNYRISAAPEIRGEILQSVIHENSRFYRQ